MNDFMKALVLVVVLQYIISPIDAFPGPVDDVIAAMVGIATINKWRLKTIYKNRECRCVECEWILPKSQLVDYCKCYIPHEHILYEEEYFYGK